MYRYPSEQLMTVEEAERLSELHTGRTRRKQQPRQPSLWAWQSVSGALEQTVTEAQVDDLKSGCPRLLPSSSFTQAFASTPGCWRFSFQTDRFSP